MMTLLKKFLIWILSTVCGVPIVYVVWNCIDSKGLHTLLAYSQDLLLLSATIPIPLWATILLILSCCLLVYLRTQTSNTPKNPKIKLSQLSKNILIFFSERGDTGITTKELSKIFKTTFNQTQSDIDILYNFKLLHNKREYVDDKRHWLSIKGREFLSKHKLL